MTKNSLIVEPLSLDFLMVNSSILSKREKYFESKTFTAGKKIKSFNIYQEKDYSYIDILTF